MRQTQIQRSKHKHKHKYKQMQIQRYCTNTSAPNTNTNTSKLNSNIKAHHVQIQPHLILYKNTPKGIRWKYRGIEQNTKCISYEYECKYKNFRFKITPTLFFNQKYYSVVGSLFYRFVGLNLSAVNNSKLGAGSAKVNLAELPTIALSSESGDQL